MWSTAAWWKCRWVRRCARSSTTSAAASRTARPPKAVHFGGPMGGSIPASLIDAPLDFDELSKLGAPIGAGGLLVMDEDTDMVDVARYFLDFLTNESCGKCVPCREGMRQTLKVLTNITKGKGREGDIERLEDLNEVTGAACLCALGRTASDPLQEHAALLQGRVRGADRRGAARARSPKSRGAQRHERSPYADRRQGGQGRRRHDRAAGGARRGNPHPDAVPSREAGAVRRLPHVHGGSGNARAARATSCPASIRWQRTSSCARARSRSTRSAG